MSWENVGGIKFLVNPSKEELAAFAEDNLDLRDYELRGLLVKDKLYFWPAKLLTHSQASNLIFPAKLELEVGEWFNYRINVYIPFNFKQSLAPATEIVVDCTQAVADHPVMKKYDLDQEGFMQVPVPLKTSTQPKENPIDFQQKGADNYAKDQEQQVSNPYYKGKIGDSYKPVGFSFKEWLNYC